MKKLILLMLTIVSIVACEKTLKDEYIISGTANGVENGKKVFIEVREEMGPKTIDTAVVENGKFEFKGKVTLLDLAFLKIEDKPQAALPFILEEGKTVITFDTDSVFKSKVGGTKNNDKLQEFNDKSTVVTTKLGKFERDNNERMQQAKATNDTVTVNLIMKEHSSFQEEMNVISKEFVEKNPNTYISLLLLENFLNRGYYTQDEVKVLFEKVDKSLLETKSAKEIKKTLDAYFALSIGKKALEFSGPNPEGKQIALKEVMGKVTIIDFWASWCGPCRAENPNVVAMYNELHPQGLNIIGVSLDKDADKWKEAIKKDNLTWTHVSNLQQWQDPIAQLYNIQQIPSTFILDANGIIVAKDLRGDELKAKVKELLAL